MRSLARLGAVGAASWLLVACGGYVEHEISSSPVTGGAGAGGAPQGGTGQGGGGASTSGTGGAAGSAVTPLVPAWTRVLPRIELADIAADATGHLILGGYAFMDAELDGATIQEGQTFVARLHPDGSLQWMTLLPDTHVVYSVSVGPSGEVLIFHATAKITWLTPDPGPQWEQLFLKALGADGSPLWEQQLGWDGDMDHPLETFGLDLAVAENGDSILAMSFAGTMMTGAGTFVSPPGDGLSLDTDLFFARVGLDGTLVQAITVPGGASVSSVAADSSGGFAVTGALAGAADLGGPTLQATGWYSGYVARFDASMSAVWAKALQADPWSNIDRVAVGASGEVLVAGSFGGTLDFGGGPVLCETHGCPFLARYDTDGGFSNVRFHPETSIGSEWHPHPETMVAATPAGQVAFSTRYEQQIDLGGGLISSSDSYKYQLDAVVARCSEDGSYSSWTGVTGRWDQVPAGLALSPTGQLFWSSHYLGYLEWNGQVLVEAPLDADSVVPYEGSFVISVPP